MQRRKNATIIIICRSKGSPRRARSERTSLSREGTNW